MTPSGKNRRDALLNELESIRSMLQEDVDNGHIPLLLPENHDNTSDNIPVLSVIANAGTTNAITEKNTITEKNNIVEKAAEPTVDPLQAIRQAAAKVVANTGRHRESQEASPANTSSTNTSPTKTSLPAAVPAVSEREKLVEDIVRGALPRMEALLRELVQEALLQEKLHGGKR
jgi:hypothetical protein